MKKYFAILFALVYLTVYSQNALLADFKQMPTFPKSAKEAFNASSKQMNDNSYSYISYSKAFENYGKLLELHMTPYSEAATNKANATNDPAAFAAKDFEDLSSPEMQKKIAAMSQEEKIKFAAEMQTRIQQNKNVQTLNKINKPDPLISLSTQISTEVQTLIRTIVNYTNTPTVNYDRCSGLCKETDAACAKIVSTCESKLAHETFNKEVKVYEALMAKNQAAFITNKSKLEKLLEQFDAESKKYTTSDIHASALGVYTAIAAVSDALIDCEESGTKLIIMAKNNVYCINDF